MAYNYNPFGAGAGNEEPAQQSSGGDFFWNPLGGSGVYDNPAPEQSAFNPFQSAPPSYEPEQSARMSAFDQMGSSPDSGWNYTPGVNGSPDRYQTDQPLVFDMSKPEPYMGSAPPADQPSAPPPGYSSPMDGGRMSPEQQYASQVRTNAEAGARDQEKERIGADLARSRADISRQAMQEQNELRAAYDERLKVAQATSRQRMEEFNNMKPEGLFAKSDGGNREALLATMVLSGVADAMSGNMQRGGYVPSAMPALESAMAKNKADNIQRLKAAEGRANMAKEDVNQIKQQHAADLVDIEHRSAAQWDYLSKDAAAQVASMAPGEARTKAEQGRVLIEQKADEAQMKAREAAEKLAMQSVDLEMKQRKLHGMGRGGSGSGKQPSVSQAKVAADVGEMVSLLEEIKAGDPVSKESFNKYASQSETISDTAESKGLGANIAKRGMRFLGVIPDSATEDIPDGEAKTIQAIERLKGKQQNLFFGSSLSAAEKAEATAQFGINIGDSPEKIERKMALTAKLLEERMAGAGGLAPDLKARLAKTMAPGSAAPTSGGSGGSAAPPQIPGARLQRNPSTGAYRYVYPDGTIKPPRRSDG